MSKPPTRTMPTPQRILVISANPRLRERFYDVLSPHGLLVTTAVSCDNGLEFLRQGEPFGLIFLDGTLPAARRNAFLERVRYGDDRLPVILLTHPEQEGADSSALRRLQTCLAEEATDRELLAAVTRWLPPPRAVTAIRYPGPILLVDDEPELLKNLQAFLSARGCTVLTASSGEAALAQLAKHRPAVVFLDIKMPGMDGLVTLKKMKGMRPDLAVIMATAVEDEAAMEHALHLGALDYIFKPYNLAVLEAQLLSMKARAGRAPASHAA